MKSTPIRFAQHLAIVDPALGVTLWAAAQPVHALPEYAARTGEACATCHVSPGGGGPRAGPLWR
jgi:mono/diheme cytochrome c family protein